MRLRAACILVTVLVFRSASITAFLTQLYLILNCLHLVCKSVNCLWRAILNLTVLLQVIRSRQKEPIVLTERFCSIMVYISQLTLQHEVTCRSTIEQRLSIAGISADATFNHCVGLIDRESVIGRRVFRPTPLRWHV